MTFDQQPRRERAFNVPAVVVALCVVLLGIYALREIVAPEIYGRLFVRFAFVPGRFTFAFAPDRVSAALNATVGQDDIGWQIARTYLGDGSVQWWTPLTYALLHGSWAHVGLNCLWLVAFGGAVAKRLHAMRFLALLGLCALAGALAHFLVHMTDLEPVVGASAAVAGAIGAAARFVFRSRARMSADEVAMDRDAGMRQPALSLVEALGDRRVLAFVAIWFVSNLLFGLSGAGPGTGGATVAWEAHVGGFLAGFLLFGLFDLRPFRQTGPERPA